MLGVRFFQPFKLSEADAKVLVKFLDTRWKHNGIITGSLELSYYKAL